MEIEELNKKCPIIMDTANGQYTPRQALLVQGEFFKTHTFIFKILSSREEMILRSRCGMNTGKIEKLSDIAEKLNITHQRVCQLEKSALKKLRTPQAIHILSKYDDSTFDKSLYEKFESDFKNLIRDDILRSIDEETLQIIKDIDIEQLPLELRKANGITKRLKKGGIATCGELIVYMRNNGDFKKFGFGKDFTTAVSVAICGLIEGGYAEIVCDEHKIEYERDLNFKAPLIQTTISVYGPASFDSMLIEELGLSTRTIHCLKRVKEPKIETIGDLIRFYNSHNPLSKHLQNFGLKCEKEVINKLAQVGAGVGIKQNINSELNK